MIGIARAHLGRTPLPCGDYFRAARHRKAVIETEIALLLAHLAPVRRIERRGHAKVLHCAAAARFHFAGKCSTGLELSAEQPQRGDVASGWSWADASDGMRRRSTNSIRAKSRRSICSTCWNKRIAEVDRQVNALPTLCFDRARTQAKALMKKPAGERGLLAGMPVPIKDLTNVEGVLTTQGSPIYKDSDPCPLRSSGRTSRT